METPHWRGFLRVARVGRVSSCTQWEAPMHYLFEITAKPGYTIEQYAEAWVRASELIQQAPGAQGTRLHRKIGD